MGSKLELPKGCRLENIWKSKSQKLKEEITTFWFQNNVLGSTEQAEKRIDQVFSIARNEADNIVAVNSVYEQYVQLLKNNFYCYRTFVTVPLRRSHLASLMITNTRDYLNQLFVKGEQPEIIGMFVVVENEYLIKHRNQAVWPYSKFVFIGEDNRGSHLRVFYFDNAKIS